MPALQLSNHRVHSKRKLALEVLESRFTLDRSWFESSQLPLLIDGASFTVADINVNTTLTVADIDLWVNLDHAQPSELNLTLISPAGTEIRMITGRGGDGTGFHDNIIDDQAQLAFGDSEPISGERYRPEQPLNSFKSEQAKGTWHLRVEDNNPLVNNGTLHSFWIGITSPPDDHGNSRETASPLLQSTSALFSESGNIETTGDQDWFSWTATKNCSIQINLDAANGTSLDTYITLRNTSGESLITDDDSGPGTNSQLVWQAVAGQTYFIDAKSYGTSTGTYGVRLFIIQDDYESTAATAFPLPLTAINTWSVSGAIETVGDHDWFSWTASKNCSIQINLDAANNSPLDTYITLRNAAGESLISDDDSGPGTNSQLVWQAVAEQTYFIDAKSYGTGTGTYGVRLLSIQDDYESTVAAAFPLPSTANNTWSVSGAIETVGDHDWFSWVAPETGAVQASIIPNVGSQLAPDLVLRNSEGYYLDGTYTSITGGTASAGFSITAGQTYYFDIDSYYYFTSNTGIIGSYNFTLTLIQDDYESTAATAFPLPLIANNTWSVSGTIETAGDADWFSWVAPETGGVRASIIPNIVSQLAPDLVLRNSEGYYLDRTYTSITGGTASAGFSVTAGQVYYFDLDSYYYYASSTGSIGSYNFTISQIHDDYADSEANAALLQQLASAEWSISGDIDWETDRDLFLWTAPNTGQAFINMNAFSNDSLDSFLTVYDSRHNQLLSNDNHGNSFNSRLFMPVIEGETYYFESSSAQRSLGRYDITLELTQIEPIPTKIQSVNTSVIAFSDDVIKHRLFIPAAGHYLVYARPVVAKPIQSEFASIRILLDTSNRPNESLFVTDSSGPANSGRDHFQRSGRWLEFDALAPGNFDIYVHGDGKWTGGYELTVSPETLVNDSQIYTSNLDSGISSRSGIIDSPGDRDLYKILNDTTESMLISFDLVASNESSLLPKIFREDGLNEKTIELAAGKSITIYATGLDPLGPSSTGAYTLTITALHDDVPAGTVRQLTSIPFNGTFESRSDRDAFSFTADNSGKYTVSMVRRNSSVMYDCYAYSTADYTSPYLAYLSESGTSSTLDLVAGQTIYIDDKSYNSSGDYTISITRSESNTIVADSIADSSATNSKLSYSASSTSAISSSIESSGDKDWIRLTVPVSQSYKINLDSDSGSFLDCYLTIRDESGNTLASDDDSGPGLNSQLTINLNSEKFYYAEAKGYSSTTGKYTLTIATETQGLTSDIGDLTSPQMIESNINGSIKSSIETCYDQDAFKYTSTKDGLLTINLDSASSLDPILEIYDSTGSKAPIASNDDYGLSLNSQVLVPVSKNQTVYFVARGYSASIGSYSLSWNLTDSPSNTPISDAPSKYSDFTEAKNDAFTLISSTSTDIVVKAAINPGGDIDVYKWSSAESCKVSFALNASDTKLDPYLRILDDKGSVLNYDDDGGSGINALIGNFKARSGTVYYIECKGYSSYSTGSYELTIHTTTTSAPQPFDPNRDEAPSLPDNQTPTIQFDGATGVVVGCINGSMMGPHTDPNIVPYDVDTYRLDTTAAGGAVTIRLERESSFGFETSQLNPVLAVLDATMQVSHRFAWQEGIDSPHSLTIPIAKNSTIYLQIAGQNGTVGGYRLSIDRQFDDVANGPLFGLPEQLSIDGPSVSRRIQYSGDDDYFAVRTSGTGRIRFDLKTQDKNSSTILSITDANENELARSTDGIIEIDAPIGIEIYAHVQGYGTSTFAYSISASSASAIPNDEAGDTILTARCLTPIQDSINSRYIAFGAGANNPIFNTLSDTDTWSFTAPSTGKYHLESGHSTIRSATVIRVYRQEGGVNAGNFFADDNHNLSADFQAQAGETVFFSLRGVPNNSYSFSVSLSNANNSLFVGTNLMRQIGATLDDSFSAQWLALQSGGANRSRAMFANHLVSQNLVHTLQSQSFSTGISFLIVWLDPVDSNLIDGSGQAIGTREQTGIVNGLTNGNISTRGNLDLIVIANPQGSSFPMTLYGVGGGRVLGGAALVGSNGSVTLQSIDYPDVSSNGLQLVLFGENKTVAPPPPPITGPPINPIVKIDPKIPNTTIIGLDPTLVTSSYTALLGSVMTAITPMSVLVASNSGSPQNTDSATIIPWWLTNVDLTENFNEWSAIIFVRMRLCVAPIIVSINHMAQPILDLPGVRDVSGLLLQAVQPAIHAATSTVDAIDQAMIELPFVRKLRSGWKIPRIISASPTSITNPALNPTTTEAPVTNLGVIIFISGCGHVISKTGRKKSRGIHSQLLRSYSNWTQL